MSSLFRTFALVFAVLLGGLDSGLHGEEAAPVPEGKRVFTCAHSFHAFVYRELAELAGEAHIQGHENVGISSIGGSRVIQHWDVPEEKNAAKAALTAGRVDVLTLAPIWMPDDGIEKFARLGFEHNPKILVTVQEFWLPNDTYEPRYPLETHKPVDHDAADLDELQKNQNSYDHDVDAFVQGINKALGREVIVTVPVGQAAVALRRKIVAGEAPGLEKQSELFRDTWGHPQAALRTLSAYCHFAVIYHRSPVGLGVPSDLAKGSKPETVDKLNLLLQQLAWDAVAQHGMSGVKGEGR